MQCINFTDQIQLPVFYFSPDSETCLGINIYAENICEYTTKEIKNITISNLFDSKDLSSINDLLAKYHNNQRNLETTIKTKSNNRIPVKLHITGNLNKRGKLTELILLGQLNKHENELELENKILRLKAEESEKLKTEFFNNISHEIRTPMSGIMGFADLLKTKNISKDTQEKYIEIINQSSLRLMSIIDNILEISTLETNQIEKIEKDKIDADFILDKLHKDYNQRFAENNIVLIIKKNNINKKILFYSDSEKLYKILNNLVDNSLKFTQKGSVTIECSTDNNLLTFSIKDTGIGIDPQKEKLIFNSFAQEDSSSSRAYGGLGLGLAIAKKYASLLGGEITFDSTKGKGTTFRCILPYSSAEDQLPDKEKEMQVSNKLNKTVLVAEDEGINFLYLQSILNKTNESLKIIHARNGQEAIDMVLQNNSINLILMDLKMPVMDGFDATKKIRSIYPELPIVAQTAYSTQNDIDLAKAAGCNDYLIKPVKEKELVEILNKYT